MALAWAEIGSGALAWQAADKPVLIGVNYLRDATSVFWSSDSSQAAADDDTSATQPTTRLYDDFTHLRSAPDSALNTWYIHIALASASTVDCIAMLDHTMFSVGINQIVIDVADNINYTSSQEVYDGDPVDTGNPRVVLLDLKHTGSTSLRYTGVTHVRFKFVSPVVPAIPNIGEIMIGRRRFMQTKPRGAFDPSQMTSKITRHTTPSGSINQFTHHYGRRRLNAVMAQHDGQDAVMEAFFETDIEFGTKPFLWIQNPTSDPTDAPFMLMDPPSLVAPTAGFDDREWSLTATEQGPNFVSQEG